MTLATTSTPVEFLPDIAERLADSYRAAGRSERTIQSYTESIRQLSTYLIDTFGTDDPDDVSSSMLESYIGWQRTTRSAGTARLRFASLRASWRWMLRRGFAQSDIFAGIPAPIVDSKVTHVIEEADVRAILATTDGPAYLARRDRAIILTLADSGCRRGDIAGAKLDDLDIATGRLLLRGTKSNRDRQIALSPVTLLVVKRWLKVRRPDRAGSLFTTRVGEPMTPDAVYQAIQRRYREAGVRPDRAVHAFRSFAAVHMIANGAGELEVQALLGWSSNQMLKRYLRGTEVERALTRHSTFSPVSRL